MDKALEALEALEALKIIASLLDQIKLSGAEHDKVREMVETIRKELVKE